MSRGDAVLVTLTVLVWPWLIPTVHTSIVAPSTGYLLSRFVVVKNYACGSTGRILRVQCRGSMREAQSHARVSPLATRCAVGA